MIWWVASRWAVSLLGLAVLLMLDAGNSAGDPYHVSTCLSQACGHMRGVVESTSPRKKPRFGCVTASEGDARNKPVAPMDSDNVHLHCPTPNTGQERDGAAACDDLLERKRISVLIVSHPVAQLEDFDFPEGKLLLLLSICDPRAPEAILQRGRGRVAQTHSPLLFRSFLVRVLDFGMVYTFVDLDTTLFAAAIANDGPNFAVLWHSPATPLVSRELHLPRDAEGRTQIAVRWVGLRAFVLVCCRGAEYTVKSLRTEKMIIEHGTRARCQRSTLGIPTV